MCGYFALIEGVVEVWLTSEDLGAYGCDIGVSLPDLLWQLVAVVPDNCMMRLGMTNPPYILEHMEVRVCHVTGDPMFIVALLFTMLSCHEGDGADPVSPSCVCVPACPSAERV